MSRDVPDAKPGDTTFMAESMCANERMIIFGLFLLSLNHFLTYLK